MKIAVIGSREIGDFSVNSILEAIQIIENDTHLKLTELVSGGALGIDTLAETAAELLHVPIRVFRPDYKQYGRWGATFVRNRQIVAYADYVAAFWDYQSKGTANTISLCIESQTPCRIFSIRPSVLL